ncbi:hypothetical protein T11_16149 [Trichinella zimbabwensis]|nr:hypothetical protein T11_16149 [Trichinella zimbabwensis]
MVLHSFQGIAVSVIVNFKRQQRIAFLRNTSIMQHMVDKAYGCDYFWKKLELLIASDKCTN